MSICNKGIIMKILKYVCSYTICMLIYIWLSQNPFQLCLNVLPHIAKLYKHGKAIIQRVTNCYHTCYRAFSPSLTWVGYNATRYRNFKVLAHVILYIFA